MGRRWESVGPYVIPYEPYVIPADAGIQGT